MKYKLHCRHELSGPRPKIFVGPRYKPMRDLIQRHKEAKYIKLIWEENSHTMTGKFELVCKHCCSDRFFVGVITEPVPTNPMNTIVIKCLDCGEEEQLYRIRGDIEPVNEVDL